MPAEVASMIKDRSLFGYHSHVNDTAMGAVTLTDETGTLLAEAQEKK